MFDGNGLLLSNDAYLTLSFAADGTSVAGQANALVAKFNAIAPQSVWEDAIMQAFQTWAVRTNADVGIVSDGGQPFGTSGPTHGDPRFGDIRIGAISMDPQVGAESTPLDRIVGGTWQADVVFNTNFNFQTVNDIYEIALHEAGHVFGLEHSTDPNSPMHGGTIPTASQPTAQDTTNLQLLYGTRIPDFNELDNGGGPTLNNNSINTPTLLVVDDTPGAVRGSAPVLAYGDITSANDVDFFRLRVPDTYSGVVTVEVRSAGISLLTPWVRVYNSNHQLIHESVSMSTTGDTLSYTIANAAPGDNYYFEVSGATADVFGLGGYAIKATFDSVAQVQLSTLNGYRDSDLRKLSQDEIRQLIVPSADHFLNEDAHIDDNLLNAVPLQEKTDFTDPSRFDMVGSISDASDTDFYRVRSPQNILTQANVLTVTLRTLSAGRLVPKVRAFDRNLVELPVTVLANGGGELVVQVAGIESNRNYYLEVAADNPSGPFNIGNYQLTASFRDQAANFQTFATGTLAPGAAQNQHSLYVAQPQLFHFLLQSGTQPLNYPAAVIATIYNEGGNVVYQLSTPVGKSQSQGAVLLAPGTYSVHISSLTFQGPLTTAVDYTLSGIAISDPFVSDPNDQTTSPFANPDPTLGGAFVYPGGIYSNDPFLWDSFIRSLPSAPPPDVQTQIVLLIGNWWAWFWGQTRTNGPALSQADGYSTGSNTTLHVSAAVGVLGNDIDPEGDPMAAVLVAGPSSGTLNFNADGSFQYTPAAGFNGIVLFTYQTSDFRQLSNLSTVSIAVGLVADFDHNGMVDQLDYDTWRANFGATGQANGDGSGNGSVDAADYVLWRKNKPPAGGAAAALSAAEPAANTAAILTIPSVVSTELNSTSRPSEPVAQVVESPASIFPIAAAQGSTLNPLTFANLLFKGIASGTATPLDLNLMATWISAEPSLSATDIAFNELNASFEALPVTDGQLSVVAFEPLLQIFGNRYNMIAGLQNRWQHRPAFQPLGFSRSRRGFTLIELLVVIAIIGALVALLLPAIQAAREAARRSQCANNMRQLSLAVLNYESSRKELPPAGIAQVLKDPKFGVDIFNPLGGLRFSWIVEILPFMEEQSLYDKFDHSKSIMFQDQNPQAVSIESLLCPSDNAFGRSYKYHDILKTISCAKGNYAAFVSPFHVDLQLLFPGSLIASGQRMGQILGGTNQTLLLSEVRTLDHENDQRGAWVLPLPGASLLAFDMHPIDWPYEEAAGPTTTTHVAIRMRYIPNPSSVGNTQRPNGQGPNKDTLEEGAIVADQAAAAGMPCVDRVKSRLGVNGYMSAAPRSLHPGGVNSSYLDGHVSFLENDVDDVVMALAVSVTDE